MVEHARIEIAAHFLKQPVAQAPRRMLGAARDKQLRHGEAR
jgi:hypothetical protein